MKRFHFVLRPVGVLRAHEEKRAQQAMAAASQQCAAAEQVLQVRRAAVTRFADAMRAGRETKYSAQSAAWLAVGYARETVAEKEAMQALAAAQEQLRLRRHEYLDARRRHEVVQRLEQKARQAHWQGVLHEEQATFDELSSSMFVRARRAVEATAGDQP